MTSKKEMGKTLCKFSEGITTMECVDTAKNINSFTVTHNKIIKNQFN